MDWFTGFIAFLLIWWVSLFCVLPWGLDREASSNDGMTAGVPVNPKIKSKFLITTLISVVLWIILYILIKLELIDLFYIAEQMMREDQRP